MLEENYQSFCLVSHHCISHQLALACRQSANDIPYLHKLKSALDQVIDFTVIQLFGSRFAFYSGGAKRLSIEVNTSEACTMTVT